MGGEPHALCPEEGGAVILAQGAPSDGLPIFGEERDLRERNMRRGKYSSFEGVSTQVPFRGSVVKILEDLERGIRSGFSYTGARSLKQLQAKATFVRQTNAGLGESRTHINTRKW